MDLKVFLLVGLCCVLRASAQDMRDKAMQASQSGQFNRLYSRFGRNAVAPQRLDKNEVDLEELNEKQLNEILNTLELGEGGELGEPGMADSKWRLPLERQLLKYLWSRKSRSS